MQEKKLRTVLLVDDDNVVVASLQHALSQAGFHVLVAADGREALLRHEHSREAIDLLITDLQMPYMSGQDLARHLLATRPGLPIIFISGDPDAQPFPTDADFPNHVFLQKPFLPSELIACVPK
jgi:two-component system, cell cycle sensor histidine kinase and response regulator CckA